MRYGFETETQSQSSDQDDEKASNFVPGAVSADRRQVSLSAYNNATARRNVFNQTDLTYAIATGRIRHTLLAGAELGRQLTDNLRNTGFFNDTTASILVPTPHPRSRRRMTFRQNATDADKHLRTNVSLWNTYRVHARVAAGLGVLYRSDMFAAIDNTVTLPGDTRADAAAYFRLSKIRTSLPASRQPFASH